MFVCLSACLTFFESADARDIGLNTLLFHNFDEAWRLLNFKKNIPFSDPAQSPFQRGFRPAGATTASPSAADMKKDVTVTSVSSLTSGLGPSDVSSDEFGFAGDKAKDRYDTLKVSGSV